MLDACVLINILASGRAQDILTNSEHEFAVCMVVSKESIYLRSADPNVPREAVDLKRFVEAQCLRVYGLQGNEEEALYVDYATDLDDGEAMSLALAFSRGFLVATDDRKARRIFLDDTGDATRLLSTTQIVKAWSEKAELSAAETKQLLREISARGRFSPHSGDPEFLWWSKAIA